MYLSHSDFVEFWWNYPPDIHKLIAFCYLYDKERELRAFRRFFKMPVSELKRINDVYVAKIKVRPLLNQGLLGLSKNADSNDRFRSFFLLISFGMDRYETLKTFVHELIHIYLYEQGVITANEDWIETASERIMQKHRAGIEKLFNNQEVEYIQPKT